MKAKLINMGFVSDSSLSAAAKEVLTLNKVYDVTESGPWHYTVVCDKGYELGDLYKERFEPVEEPVVDPVAGTVAEREKTHGNFAVTADISQRLLNALQGGRNWEIMNPIMREACQMICSKLARIVNGNCREKDHWHDISGYAYIVQDRGCNEI